MRKISNDRLDRLKTDLAERLRKTVLVPLLTLPFLAIDIQFFKLLGSTYPATAGPVIDAIHIATIVTLAFLMVMGIDTVLDKRSCSKIFVALASMISIVMILIGSATLWIRSNDTFFAIAPAAATGIYVGIAACIVYLLAALQWFRAKTDRKTNAFK
jgi:hypothetical protein